jgi:Tfp pilus assembly PilM family ATPase
MRSIGIDPGDLAVKVVELDGSYKRARLLHVHVGSAGAPTAVPAARCATVAGIAKAALAEGMKGEVALGHPCREAVLRTLELPFQGHDAIRKVVKAEIEGEIQSQAIDDMVVDFLELGPGASGGTRVLVASVPKAGLRTQLAELTAAGVEPEDVDLDTMALWRAAHFAGAFALAEGETAAAPRTTVVVDIGSRSVKVLLVEGDKLVEMRALRIGESAVADEVARKHGLDPLAARAAVHQCLLAGGDITVDAATLAAPVVAEGETAAPAAPSVKITVDHDEVEAAHTAWLQRLARELTRYLTASGRADQVRAVHVTGGAASIPGTSEMLAAVFGFAPQPLDVLAKLQHELTPEQVADLGPRIATAVGLALGRLGGPKGFQLRQEDLVLTRGFERVKFPLAIACMLGLLAIFVQWNRQQVELGNLELRLGSTYQDPKDPKKVSFYGMLHSVFRSGWFDKPDHFRFEQQKGKDYSSKDLVADLAALPVQDRVRFVRDKLRLVADQKQKQSGVYEDVSVESGLAVLVRWAEIMKELEPSLGRFLVTKIDLNMAAPNRRLTFTIAFRGDDFRSRREALKVALDAELTKDDSPFEKPDPRKGGESEKVEQFRDTAESGVAGAYYTISLEVKDAFQAFGPSRGAGGTSVGAAPTRADGSANEVAAKETGR